MVGLPDGEKSFEDIYNRLDSIPACDRQTDRRTDRQTSCHGIVRAMHMRRAVKTRRTALRHVTGNSSMDLLLTDQSSQRYILLQ